MDKKKSCLLMTDWYDLIQDLSDAQRGRVLTGIFIIGRGDEFDIDAEEPAVRVVLRYLAGQIQSNNDKYEEICEKRAAAGKKGGQANASFAKQKKAKKANASFAKHTDSESDTDTDTESVSGSESKTEGQGHKVKDFCSEPSPTLCASVEALPLNDGSEWRPTIDQYHEYERLYPSVDIIQEFRKMRGWCLSNPTRKKTRGGIARFVNNWLAGEQDSPKKTARSGTTGGKSNYDEFMQNLVNITQQEQGGQT